MCLQLSEYIRESHAVPHTDHQDQEADHQGHIVPLLRRVLELAALNQGLRDLVKNEIRAFKPHGVPNRFLDCQSIYIS